MSDEIAIFLTKERWLEIQEMAESVGIGVEEFINLLFDIGQQFSESVLENYLEAMQETIIQWQRNIKEGGYDE